MAVASAAPGQPSERATVGGDTVSTAGLTVAARCAGLSLLTWLVILLIVVVFVAILARRRV
jgi:hypothetical protein